jgi:hypothetical protein
MRRIRSYARALLPFAVGLALMATTTAANAAPANAAAARPDAGRTAVPIVGTTAGTATGTSTRISDINSCPVPGQRVKTSYSPEVYLVDPDWELYYIPGNVYFNLWDSWSGIVVNNDLPYCYAYAWVLSNAFLTKTASQPQVYIYDSTLGAYRWITTAEVFNKYGFSWGKIRTQAYIYPISSLNWDF